MDVCIHLTSMETYHEIGIEIRCRGRRECCREYLEYIPQSKQQSLASVRNFPQEKPHTSYIGLKE